MYQLLNIATMNSHVDFSQEKGEDIVTYSTDSQLLLLDPRVDQRENMFYMKSKVEVNDNLFQLLRQPLYKETFQFDKRHAYNNPKKPDDKSRPLFTFYLRVSPSTRLYTRWQYSIMAYLGDLGGLIDIIQLVGLLLTTFLTRNVLEAAMITDSYQIQKFN